MSQARTELFAFIGAALATTVGIFVVQQVYLSYLDQCYHAELSTQAANTAVIELRKAEADQLDASKIPLERAKALLAEKGRAGFGSVAPVKSDDLAPVSGWIRMRGFKPAVAHPIRTPRVAEPIAVPPVNAVEPEPEAVPAPDPVTAPKPKKKPAAKTR